MQRLLVVDMSREFTDAVAREFRGIFSVQACHDGTTALELLRQTQPDILLINLSLPFTDGLTVLQQTPFRPRVIVAISTVSLEYVRHRVLGLGIQMLLIMPTLSSLRLRILDLLAETERKENPEHRVADHLRILGFRTHLDGYRQLCVAVPVFAQTPRMLLSKELYPLVAQWFRLPDCRAVEHSIRSAIADAWARRDPAVWDKYFPGSHKPPNNKAFLCRLAELLEL